MVWCCDHNFPLDRGEGVAEEGGWFRILIFGHLLEQGFGTFGRSSGIRSGASACSFRFRAGVVVDGWRGLACVAGCVLVLVGDMVRVVGAAAGSWGLWFVGYSGDLGRHGVGRLFQAANGGGQGVDEADEDLDGGLYGVNLDLGVVDSFASVVQDLVCQLAGDVGDFVDAGVSSRSRGVIEFPSVTIAG